MGLGFSVLIGLGAAQIKPGFLASLEMTGEHGTAETHPSKEMGR